MEWLLKGPTKIVWRPHTAATSKDDSAAAAQVPGFAQNPEKLKRRIAY